MEEQGEDSRLAVPLLQDERGNASDEVELEEARIEVASQLPEPKGFPFATVIITAKTILGAGMAALPRAYVLTGALVGTAFLLAVGYLTYFTVQVMIRVSVATQIFSYSGTVKRHYGWWGALGLELSLLLRTAGLMTVYTVIIGDVLAGGSHGSESYSGLLCDVTGGSPAGWCGNRPLVTGCVMVAVVVPLVSFGRLEKTAWASWLGMAGIGAWCGATVALTAVAVAKGQAHHVPLLPDTAVLGDTAAQVFTQLCAVIPIFATAYTCQMTSHFIATGLQPFSVQLMDTVTRYGVLLCTAVFLIVVFGSIALFGEKVPPDVLETFTAASLTPLVGAGPAAALYVAVRLSYLASICTIFPMQMFPFREALSRLCFSGQLEGLPMLAATYVATGVIYVVGMSAGSIWEPLQLIGATAGALIAFIYPGLLAFKAAGSAAPSSGVFTSARGMAVGGWVLLAVGVLQAVTGTLAVFLPTQPRQIL